jgi:hypothetical protein
MQQPFETVAEGREKPRTPMQDSLPVQAYPQPPSLPPQPPLSLPTLQPLGPSVIAGRSRRGSCRAFITDVTATVTTGATSTSKTRD